MIAVTSSGETYAWGDNQEFQCGMGMHHPLVNQTITQPIRIPVLIGRRAVAVACGVGHTILITANHEVFVWGSGNDGQLGLGTCKLCRLFWCRFTACPLCCVTMLQATANPEYAPH